MKIRNVLRDAVLTAAAFLGLQTLQAGLLRDALAQLDHMAARRLQVGVAGVLNKAHQAKDDISIVQVLAALNQAPGVVQAHILDPENKGVAGPRPYSYSLKNGTKKWGILVLSLSDRLRRRLLRRQWFIGTGSAALVWTLIFLYLQLLARRQSSLQTQSEELRGMLQAAEGRLNALVERERLNAAKATACLQQAVEHIESPVMVLDHQQRVAAGNAAALRMLGVSEEAAFRGKPWSEIPFLQSCGSSLEQSLQSPLTELHAPGPAGAPVLSLTTLPEGSGTWVKLFPSKHVVE